MGTTTTKQRAYRADDFSGNELSEVGNAQVRWQYVEVEASILSSGFIAPKVIIWPDRRRFEIDRIAMCQYLTFYQAWYYEVEILGQLKQLWYRHNAFFVLVQEGGTIHGGEPPEMNRHELHRLYGLRP